MSDTPWDLGKVHPEYVCVYELDGHSPRDDLPIGEQMDIRPTIKEDPAGINKRATLLELGLGSIAVFI